MISYLKLWHMKNSKKIISDFGDEWEKFDQFEIDKNELSKIYNDYFFVNPWGKKGSSFEGIDLGCGTGRWARFVAEKVKKLTVVDASEKSLLAAKKNLQFYKNVTLKLCDLTNLPFENNHFDFGYSLGVLHHIPEIKKALSEIRRILKPNAGFLLYMYYSLENEPFLYKNIWKVTNILRRVISILPKKIKMYICDLLAIIIYYPLSILSKILFSLGFDISKIPLSYYRDKSFYTMRTDALDRFGTTYEKRYSKKEIFNLLQESGFNRVKFSNRKPYWCVISYKKK